MTPLKAIRAKCLDCCCGQLNEVRLCPIDDCPLYAFRFGRGAKREMTEDQRVALSERMKYMRKAGKIN